MKISKNDCNYLKIIANTNGNISNKSETVTITNTSRKKTYCNQKTKVRTVKKQKFTSTIQQVKSSQVKSSQKTQLQLRKNSLKTLTTASELLSVNQKNQTKT